MLDVCLITLERGASPGNPLRFLLAHSYKEPFLPPRARGWLWLHDGEVLALIKTRIKHVKPARTPLGRRFFLTAVAMLSVSRCRFGRAPRPCCRARSLRETLNTKRQPLMTSRRCAQEAPLQPGRRRGADGGLHAQRGGGNTVLTAAAGWGSVGTADHANAGLLVAARWGPEPAAEIHQHAVAAVLPGHGRLDTIATCTGFATAPCQTIAPDPLGEKADSNNRVGDHG